MPGKLNGRGGVRWRDRPDSRGTTRLEAVEFLLHERSVVGTGREMIRQHRYGPAVWRAEVLSGATLGAALPGDPGVRDGPPGG